MAGSDEWRRYKSNDERGKRVSGDSASERRAKQPSYERDKGGRTATQRGTSIYDDEFPF